MNNETITTNTATNTQTVHVMNLKKNLSTKNLNDRKTVNQRESDEAYQVKVNFLASIRSEIPLLNKSVDDTDNFDISDFNGNNNRYYHQYSTGTI